MRLDIASKENRKKKIKTFYAIGFNIFLLGVLALCIIIALCAGKYPITPAESIEVLFSELFGRTGTFSEMTRNVVMGLRIPRIFASILCGIMLSMSGVAYQGIFKNPLVSPDFLGVSNGAAIGAAIAILLGFSGAFLSGVAFIGGIIAVSITVLIPTIMRSHSNIMLVLSGIIVGGAMSSILGFIKYVADPETELAAITYWIMGSFSYVTIDEIKGIIWTMLIPAVILLAMSWWIDVLSMGETEAKSLGANIVVIRNLAIACATLMTASSVCIAGTIGWIGLVIPHFARMIVGPNNTKLIPTAGLMGGIFLLIVDTLTRTISVAEMPVSILTGLIGAPFYALLLYRQRKTLT
ncbi:MAG: iron ABC transporter permease [Ruminococcaceae bacterium]|nr:iron ABC transporter permease [Oscillospiraceae bacterium]